MRHSEAFNSLPGLLGGARLAVRSVIASFLAFAASASTSAAPAFSFRSAAVSELKSLGVKVGLFWRCSLMASSSK